MPDSPYEPLDSAIYEWASAHQLQVYNEYKEYEVRSIDVPARRSWWRRRLPFQIWIDPPSTDGLVDVHAWDRAKKSFLRTTTAKDIRGALEEALTWVRSQT